MQKKSVYKYCHVNAYVAYEEGSPIYKKSFKFKLKPRMVDDKIWGKLVSTLNKNGIEAYISIILRPYKSSFPPKYPRVAPTIIPIM